MDEVIYVWFGVMIGFVFFFFIMCLFGQYSIWHNFGYETAVCESQGYEYSKTVDGQVFCGDKLQTIQYSESPVFDKETKTWIKRGNN